jgi:very-short-patch-repair endonuclease
MTPAERKLWARLRGNRLEGFHIRRQQIIEPYIVDFYCHQTALVIEVDGGIHQNQQDYDHQRDQYLQALGLHVVRFTNLDVMKNMDTVLEEILYLCRTRLSSLTQEET